MGSYVEINNFKFIIGDWLYGSLLNRLIRAFDDFEEIFVYELFGTTTCDTSFLIKTNSTVPIYNRSYLDYNQNKLLRQKIEELQEKGYIKESKSQWSSPVELKYIDDNLEICVNYNELNSITLQTSYGIPTIQSVLKSIGDSNFFSRIVIKDGFSQLPLEKGSCHKTAFDTDFGCFEFTTMRSGLRNASEYLQLVVEGSLEENIQEEAVVVYLGQILVYESDPNYHINTLQNIFQNLQDSNLKVDVEKSAFMCERVRYLGVVISADGISIDPEKLERITNFPTPRNKTEVRSFIGQASQLKRFVPNFDQFARPLYSLTSPNSQFYWGRAEHNALINIKELLENAGALPFGY